MLQGVWPRAANIQVERVAASALPDRRDAVALTGWLGERWARKEEELAEHFAKGGARRAPETPPPYAFYAATLAFWLAALYGLFVGLYTSSFVRRACLLANVAFLLVTKLGGLDGFEMRRYRRASRAQPHAEKQE